MATTSTSTPVRAASSDSRPAGLWIFFGLMISLAIVIALSFWLASDIHDHRPGPPAAEAAE